MPHECHPSLATTGAVGIATATITPGTIAATLAGTLTLPARIGVEHPGGRLDVELETRNGVTVAGLLRTARRLFEGFAFAKPASQLNRAA
jgi:2-methylaconitate cis-trans-isomerase PrpF